MRKIMRIDTWTLLGRLGVWTHAAWLTIEFLPVWKVMIFGA